MIQHETESYIHRVTQVENGTAYTRRQASTRFVGHRTTSRPGTSGETSPLVYRMPIRAVNFDEVTRREDGPIVLSGAELRDGYARIIVPSAAIYVSPTTGEGQSRVTTDRSRPADVDEPI